MRQRDLKQISQLRKLREDEKEKALVRARAAARQAEMEFFQAQQQRENMKKQAQEEEQRQWKALAYPKHEVTSTALTGLYDTIDDFKTTITKMAETITEKKKIREERRMALPAFHKDYVQAQRDKDRWQNLRDKLDEERIRKEEIALEELNSEIRLRKKAELRREQAASGRK